MVEMRKLALAALCALIAAPGSAPAEPSPSDGSYSAEELALARALFTALQPRSVAANVEICGYIYRDGAGRLRVTGPATGDSGTCGAPWPRSGTPIASWHTHGAWDAYMWNEVPSARDMQTDAFEGVDGWVATPGGRLWHVDGAARVATLVCGPHCLPGDPAYDAAGAGEIATRYTFDQLLDRFAEK